MKINKIYHLILCYSIVTISVGVLLNLMTIIIQLIKGEFETTFITLFFLALKIAFLYLTLELIKGKNNKFNLNFIFFTGSPKFFYSVFGEMYMLLQLDPKWLYTLSLLMCLM
jgi:hypothetical protein